MFAAGLGIVAALAFVLGLGAVCVWALKRWGTGAIGSRTRVPVEVVQRVPLGPKTGLAVVRVGERVMAVSVGDGGVRPLFELDEADRQRVIATSTVPMPMASSAEASAAFAPLVPASFSPTQLGTKFGSFLGKAIKAQMDRRETGEANAAMSSHTEPVVCDAPASAPVTTPAAVSPAPFTLAERAEIPKFLTAPITTSQGAPVTYAPVRVSPVVATRHDDDAFRAMLGVSLSTASRLAAVAVMVLAASAAPLRAQGAQQQQQQQQPPAVQPPAPAGQSSAVPASAGQASAVPASAVPASAVPASAFQVPPVRDPLQPPVAPTVPAGSGVRTATPAQPIALPGAPAVLPATRGRSTPGQAPKVATPPRAPRPGNGADVTAQAAASRRPMSRMVVDSVADSTGRAQAAQPAPIAADDAIMRMMPQMDVQLGGNGDNGGLRLNGTVGIVVMMGLLTLLPTLMLMMTGFTRILIVLQFLKQAMGTQTAPPGQLLAALALLLTGFVMGPTLAQVNREAITPWLDGKITQVEMMQTGVKPLRTFMLKQTRESDLATFVKLSRLPKPATVDDVPLHVLMSAFVASELRTAFQIGFAIYLPFIIIDAVVSSVLMSMGMFMLPPAMISLPFKLLLFVLVDGWSLTITSLVQSFR